MTPSDKKAQLEIIGKLKTKIAELRLEASESLDIVGVQRLMRLSNYMESITPK